MSRDFDLIDVSHSVEHGMITYKGLPAPVISDYLSREDSKTRYAPGTEFHIGKIEMVANTGTYLDSPFHRYARGKDLAHLDLYSIANLDGVVVRCKELQDPAITEEQFHQVDVRDKAVLVHTGWDLYWRTEESRAAIILFSPKARPITSQSTERLWSGSIPSTSTPPATAIVRRTQCFWAMIFRSSNISAVLAICLIVDSSFSQCRSRFDCLAHFPFARLESWPRINP